MITEDYVSFETAKLLKEKGFNRYPLFPCYKEDNGEFIDIPTTLDTINYCFIPAPTLQMAMKWLREVHHIFITIEVKGCSRKEDFIYFKWSIAKYNTDMIDRIDNNLTAPQDYWVAPLGEEETYERTCETAIKYCLENLI